MICIQPVIVIGLSKASNTKVLREKGSPVEIVADSAIHDHRKAIEAYKKRL